MFGFNSFLSREKEVSTGITDTPGVLQFPMFWTTTPSLQSIVDFTVTNPGGTIFSMSNIPTSPVLTGSYTGSPTSLTSGVGTQELDFPTQSSWEPTRLPKHWTRELSQRLPQLPCRRLSEHGNSCPSQTLVGSQGGTATLTATSPQAVFQVTAPVANGVLKRTH